MSNLYLFTGENSYALREERRRWKSVFVKKHGDENVQRLDGQRMALRELLDEVSVAPFIAEKRLLIIDGPPKMEKEHVALFASAIHPSALVLVCDPKPDKRLGATKEILKLAQVKEFPPVKEPQLSQWITSFVTQLGGSIERAAITLLIDYTGEDQDMLAEELRKLSLYARGRAIAVADVESMVSPTFEGAVWTLTDLLSAGNKRGAMRYAHTLLSRGGDAYGLWAILLNMLKNLGGVVLEVQSGRTDSKEIAEDLGIHPFALRSLLPLARKMKPAPFASFLGWAIDGDIANKTGTLRSTDEAPEELLALIDRFIVSFPA